MSDPLVLPKLLASIGALALGAIAAVIVGVLGHRTPGPAESSAPAPRASSAGSGSPATSGFPAPPEGAVVFSRPDDSDIVALAVVPGRTLGLQASVVSNQGEGVTGLRVAFRTASGIYPAEPCGAGCYGARAAAPSAFRLIEVDVARDGRTTRWKVPMPRPWPPRDASSLVAEATRTYRKLRTFEIHDRLASDATHSVVTQWRVVAPDRLDYKIENGPAAVIIGTRRWDKTPGGEWKLGTQQPIHQPTPFWKTWKDARVLATTKDGWRVSFFDPTTPGWYELKIQKGTMRTLAMTMHAQAHFMQEAYSSFNAPLRIEPPK